MAHLALNNNHSLLERTQMLINQFVNYKKKNTYRDLTLEMGLLLSNNTTWIHWPYYYCHWRSSNQEGRVTG